MKYGYINQRQLLNIKINQSMDQDKHHDQSQDEIQQEEQLYSGQPSLKNINSKESNKMIFFLIFSFLFLMVSIISFKNNFGAAHQQAEDLTHLYCIKRKVKNHLPENGQRSFLAETVYGFPIYLDTGGIKSSSFNEVAYYIATFGTWEPENIFAMAKIVRPGFKILNVGAQFGLQTIILAQIAGPNGKAVMFQPYSYSYNNLVKSIQVNNLKKTTEVFQLAVSDKAGKGFISVDPYNTGMSQINNPGFLTNFGSVQREEIQIVVLDDFLPKDSSFDFVLIDVQRYEIETILSMKQIIKRSPNMVILTEWSWRQKTEQQKNKTKADQMIQFLKERRYRIYKTIGFNAQSCSVGIKAPIEDWNKLFQINFGDLLLVPESVILPF